MKTRSTADIQNHYNNVCAEIGNHLVKALSGVNFCNTLENEYKIAKEVEDTLGNIQKEKEEKKAEVIPFKKDE